MPSNTHHPGELRDVLLLRLRKEQDLLSLVLVAATQQPLALHVAREVALFPHQRLELCRGMASTAAKGHVQLSIDARANAQHRLLLLLLPGGVMACALWPSV
jgi:hypothetical protein